MCVHSQSQQIDAIHPPCTARWNPPGRPPIDRVQVERPRSPGGASPVFGGPAGRPDRAPPWRPGRPRRTAPAAPTSRRAGAAFFDLDRTLLAGGIGRGVLRGDARRPGSRRAAMPGRARLYGLFNRIGETLPSMALARQAAILAKGRSRAAMVGRRRGRRRPAGGDGAAVRRAPVRRAPRRGPPDGARHDDALRPGQAARRPARARRRRSPPATASTPTARYDGTLAGRSCGRPASSRPCGRGPTSTTSNSKESYAYSDSFYDAPLLGAVGHPDRRQPRSADGRPGDAAAVAGPQPRRVAGRGEDPVARHRAAAAGDAVRPGPS